MAKRNLLNRSKEFYSTEEAARILGVRPHFFVNYAKGMNLEKIHTYMHGFNADDLSFWQQVIDLKSAGFGYEGILIEIKNIQKRKQKAAKHIENLEKLKTYFESIKTQLNESRN